MNVNHNKNTFRITQIQSITHNTYAISFNEHGQPQCILKPQVD